MAHEQLSVDAQVENPCCGCSGQGGTECFRPACEVYGQKISGNKQLLNCGDLQSYCCNRAKILKEGDRIIIEAGYEGYLTTSADGSVQEAKDAEGNTQEKQYGVIFDGKIIYPSRRKENNTDYVLSLLCVDGANVLGKNFIAKTLNKGVNQRQILDAVCEKSKTKIPTNSITQGLSGQKLPRGKVILASLKIISPISPAVMVRAIG